MRSFLLEIRAAVAKQRHAAVQTDRDATKRYGLQAGEGVPKVLQRSTRILRLTHDALSR